MPLAPEDRIGVERRPRVSAKANVPVPDGSAGAASISSPSTPPAGSKSRLQTARNRNTARTANPAEIVQVTTRNPT